MRNEIPAQERGPPIFHSAVPAQERGPPAPSCQSRLKDGGGICSSADWKPQPTDSDIFAKLRLRWLSRIHDWGVVQRLLLQIKQGSDTPLFVEEEAQFLRQDLQSFLLEQGLSCHANIADNQPLALDLLHGLLRLSQDIDQGLPGLLEHGVPTGIEQTIPASGVWPAVEAPERLPLELITCEEPWGSGLSDPKLLMKLVQEDVDQGFAAWLPGGLLEAKQLFGEAVAAGKLGLVKKEGSAPRLVGDSTVSHANSLCRIAERIELPSLQDVKQFLSRYPHNEWCGFLLDVSKAHKRVKIAPKERGYSLFAVIDHEGKRHWVYYKTCHFGCSWAAYWWARVSGAFLRVAHKVLFEQHFLAMYVDDALALFHRSSAPLCASILLCLSVAINLPLSWKKIRLGTEIKWIGWDIALTSTPRATLPIDKKCRLETVLGLLSCKGRKIARKELEKATGLLSWFATGVRCLRPWLCHFYQLLHSPKINIKALDAKQLQEVYGLTVEGNISPRNAVLSDVCKGWQIRAVGSAPFESAEDLLTTAGKHNQVWVKFAEWGPKDMRVTEAVAEAASFYKAMVQLQTPVPLLEADGPLLPAAADAFADAHSAGIGGWWLPANKDLQPSNLKWFSIQLTVNELPDWFHQGKKDLQTHICALEALAQLVLTACIIEDGLAPPSWAGSVVLRQWSDNQGTVGAFTKNMSMRPSLAGVLQACARLCQQHGVALRLSHVAGERNAWADALSRGPLQDPAFWKQLDQSAQWTPHWKELLDLGRKF